MKSSFLLLIAIFLNSCLTYAPPDQILYDNGLVDFAMDIAKNPDKLYDLKKYYPQFYDENYLHITLKDTIIKGYQYSSSLKDRINRLKTEFTEIEENIIPVKLGIYHDDIENFNDMYGTNYHFSENDLWGLSLHKENHNICLEFIFVRSDTTKFNLFFTKTNRIKVKM